MREWDLGTEWTRRFRIESIDAAEPDADGWLAYDIVLRPMDKLGRVNGRTRTLVTAKGRRSSRIGRCLRPRCRCEGRLDLLGRTRSDGPSRREAIVTVDAADVRYDTASLRTYAANLREFWTELQRPDPHGMNRDEATECVLELIRTIAQRPPDADS